MIDLVHGRIFMAQKIFHYVLTNFFLKIISKYHFFCQNSSNLPKISPDIRDIFKNLSLKSEYPLNRGSLNRVFLTIGLFLCRTQNLILANARNSRILIGPGNAKNLKEVSPSSTSFRYAPSFSVRGFGVKKLKMTTMRSHDASLRDFFARRYHVYLTTNFSKAASRLTDV